MIAGNPMDKIVVVESPSAWEFANELSGVMQQNSLLYVSSTYIDAYMYKAVLVERGEFVPDQDR